MEQVDPDVARWAVGPGGLAAIAAAAAAFAAGEDALTVGTRLRRDHDGARAAFATAAAVARRRAVDDGVSAAEQLVLTGEAGQQASHPAVAAWRAARAAAVRETTGDAGPIVDLCAGTGADAVALAAHAPVVAVERDEGRAILARHRAAVTGAPVEVLVGDALTPPLSLTGHTVHADPDRRDATGRRARSLDGHGPSVAALLGVLDADDAAAGLVTVAPGTAWDDPALPAQACLTFVEHEGRLMEAVLEIGSASTARGRAVRTGGEGARGAVVLERSGDVDRLPVSELGAYLVRPSVAAVRARLHDVVGADAGAWRVADHRALLTADDAIGDPWLTSERIVATFGTRPRALAAWLRSGEPGASDARDRGVAVLTHGVDVSPSRYLRDAGRPRTSPSGLRIHLVRRDRDAIAVVTAPDG